MNLLFATLHHQIHQFEEKGESSLSCYRKENIDTGRGGLIKLKNVECSFFPFPSGSGLGNAVSSNRIQVSLDNLVTFLEGFISRSFGSLLKTALLRFLENWANPNWRT